MFSYITTAYMNVIVHEDTILVYKRWSIVVSGMSAWVGK